MTHGTADSESNHTVTLTNQQARHAVDELQLVEVARRVLAESAFPSATISLAVVDDATIHELNRRYLEHDWPTDVLSFALDQRDGHLEGEVVLSADTAAAAAAEIGWPVAAEQLLYVIHGMLHLVGYRDDSPDAVRAMRAAENYFLKQLGLEQPDRRQSTQDAIDSLASADGKGGPSAS